MISFALSEEQQAIQETVRRFATTELRPRAREIEQAGVPAALRRTFHELGLALCDLPERFGGLGLSTAAIVHEELAFGDPGAAVALFAPHLVPGALVELGDERQATRWLSRLDRPGARGAVGWNGTVTAKRDGDDWILDGEKRFVVNGDGADVIVVLTEDQAFVVEGSAVTPGRRAAWGSLQAVPVASLSLAGVRVGEADRLRGDRIALARFFARAQVVAAARQVGLARAGFEFALAYTQERTAFGQPIAQFQSVSFDLAEMAMEVDAARCMVWRAAAELDAGGTSGVFAAAKAAMQANQGAWRVADDAVQLLGGAGFIRDFPVEKWLRDTKALAVLGQVDEVSQQTVAGGLLETGIAFPVDALQPVVT